MNQSIKKIAVELAATKEKMTHFDAKFASIAKKQGENASTQTTRFDKLEHLIDILTNAIVPQNTPFTISPLLNSNVNTLQSPSSPNCTSLLSVIHQNHPLGSRYQFLDNLGPRRRH